MEPKKYLSVSEAARLLVVSSDTIRRWTKEGILPVAMTVNKGHRLFLLSDLQKFDGKRKEAEKNK